MKPILEVKNISKKFRIRHEQAYESLRESISSIFRSSKKSEEDFYALREVSFNIEQGETIGIIGRNGAGKSTLLKILSKITPPSSGKIISRGRIASLLEVGTGFHPELTGRENIFLNGSILGMKRKEIIAKFDEIIDFSGVEKFLDTPLKHYSSGMQLRLAFAVAAFLEPEILVIDEVLAVGDAEFQKKCMGKMEEVSNAGRTILFVSHNMGAVNTLCKKTILIESGQITGEGKTSDIIDLYLNKDNSTGGIIKWENNSAPCNRSFRLTHVKLSGADGRTRNSFNISEAITVEIGIQVIENGAQPRLSMILFSGDGQQMFSSLSNNDEELHTQPLQTGDYIKTCVLRGDLLNNGRFRIGFLGYDAHWSDVFKAENVLSFEAVDDGKLKKDYPGDYGGYFRPELKWSTKRS